MTRCIRGCTVRDRHLDACDPTTGCRGCLPASAAHGLLVCGHDADATLAALSGPKGLAALWSDVEDAAILRARQSGAGGRSRPIPLDVDGADWRQRVRACLVGWMLVLEEDFDATLDAAEDTIGWMVDRLGVYAGRILANRDHADQLVSDLTGWDEEDGGVHHDGLMVEGRRLAFRTAHGIPLTILCDCGDRVRVETDEQADMVCRTCGERGVRSWWLKRLAPRSLQEMTGAEVVAWVKAEHRFTLTEVTLRQWVSRGMLSPSGKDAEGRSLYLPEVVALVAMSRRERSA